MTTTTFAVTGMTCGHCVAAVTAEVTKISGVTAVDVDLATGSVTVESTTTIEPSDFADAIDEAGYELGAMSTPARLVAFVAALLVAFGAAAAVGAAVGPIDVGTPTPVHSDPAHSDPATSTTTPTSTHPDGH